MNGSTQTNSDTRGSAARRDQTGTRLSRFCFTVNNYTDDEYAWLKSFDCKWIVIGREVGESGTPHLQGAVILSRRTSFTVIKRMVGFARAHIEPMHGTPEDSLEYCSKEDPEVFVKGDMPKPGKRNDLHVIVQRIHLGETLQDLAQDTEGATAIVKFNKGLVALTDYLKPDRSEAPLVYWIHGKTGTGKTRCSVEFAESKNWDYWISHGTLQWFDGYKDQKVAILDDLRSNHAKFSFLLRLLDRYRFTVPIKGAFVKWTADVIIITSPYDPATMWSLRNDEDKRQLVRRCTRIWDMGDGKPDILGWFREDDASRRMESARQLVERETDLNELATAAANLQCNSDLEELDDEDSPSEDSEESVYDWITPKPRRKALHEWQSDDWDYLIENQEEDPPALNCSRCLSIGNCCKHDGSCNYLFCRDCPFL